MASLIVYIGTSGTATYSRTPPVVHPSDEVTFSLNGRTDAVTITFPNGSPFGPTHNSFGLDGSSSSSSSQPQEVTPSCPTGTYSFSVTPNTKVHHRNDPDRPGTVAGDIEVVPEGPKEK